MLLKRKRCFSSLLVVPLQFIVPCISLWTLSGCRPLYNTFYLEDVKTKLQYIKVESIPNRFGHYLTNDLIFALNGTGETRIPRYRLVVACTETKQTPLVSASFGRATAATQIIRAEYRLLPMDSEVPLLTGFAVSDATYNRSNNHFANLSAAQNSDLHNARAIAETIRTQLAARLANSFP